MAQLWTVRGSEETLLSTELNSLANAARAITSTAISNDAETSERRIYADIELSLATQGTARSASAWVEVYFLPELDGTNYAYGGTALDAPANALVGSFPFDASVTARVNILTHILLPQSNFHVLLKNNTGQTFAASGNTLTMRRYSVEDV